MKAAMWIFGGLVGGFVLLAVIGSNMPGSAEQDQERRAITVCWDSHEKKSLGPAEKRFIASTCEMMEDRYRKKHNQNP